MDAAYRRLHESGELAERAWVADGHLGSCDLCARYCRIDRHRTVRGAVCRTGEQAVVDGFGPHHGEERPLSGWRGSGTIFFSWCSLRCVFCQNWEISQRGRGHPVDAATLAGMMMWLQDQGCHNINLVTPSHVVAQFLAALVIAANAGLRLPLVYNTGGYDSPEALALLDGVVDIYMPDMKYGDSDRAHRYSHVPDYVAVNQAAVREMHRQVGDLVIDECGLALRGLLVRHLVLPDDIAGTEQVLAFLAREISTGTYLNLMAQYRPCYRADEEPPLDRRIRADEYRRALDLARQLGLNRLDPLPSHHARVRPDGTGRQRLRNDVTFQAEVIGRTAYSRKAMGAAEFRFHGWLNDFLLPGRRDAQIRRAIGPGQTVKDAIEAIGVPHPEVARVTANGQPVDFSYRLRDGDQIAVYPTGSALDAPAPDTASALAYAREPIAGVGEARFVVDGHLGRLASYLRVLGFDTWYRNHAPDHELAERAATDDRLLLTRDRGLLKRSIVRRGYCIRSDRPTQQLVEVVRRFELAAAARPFGRCLRCNGVLETIDPELVADRVPPRVRREQREFRRCPDCDGLYWKGSHYARMLRLVEASLAGRTGTAARIEGPSILASVGGPAGPSPRHQQT
jgi:putative pyruvate formate lyase activating enzyme